MLPYYVQLDPRTDILHAEVYAVPNKHSTLRLKCFKVHFISAFPPSRRAYFNAALHYWKPRAQLNSCHPRHKYVRVIDIERVYTRREKHNGKAGQPSVRDLHASVGVASGNRFRRGVFIYASILAGCIIIEDPIGEPVSRTWSLTRRG